VDAGRIRKHPTTIKRISVAHRFGLKMEPEELADAMAAKAITILSRQGIYHGDLHLRNVMVRQRDAIVIDFGSMRDDGGPITADPSALEASIVFGAIDCDNQEIQNDWLRFAEQVYSDPINPLRPMVDHFRYAWMARAVRELRHVVHCCGVTPDEQILVLAASILRQARFAPAELSNPVAFDISEERKAYAMVIAEKLFKMVPYKP
jgi:hypothetical protein